jgi:ferrochelatase
MRANVVFSQQIAYYPEQAHAGEFPAMKGVLVVNLGTPEAPTPGAVGAYLREFLADPRVVQLPRWLWLPLLRGVIVPLRRKKSAGAYAKIWTDQGSPLLVGSRSIAEQLATVLGDEAQVAVAMRYGEPSVIRALDGLRASGVSELTVLPLYPQYSHTTTASVFDAVESACKVLAWNPPVNRVMDYHQHPSWVNAVADSVRTYQNRHGVAQKLLISMHGIPQRYARQGDPYPEHCQRSAAAIAATLGLQDGQWVLTYQSRFGREPWLQPYTDEVLRQLASEGVKHVQVLCPGFATDCLETLEEIAILNKSEFLAAGGQRFDYIPALNERQSHIECLAELARTAWQG